MDPRHSAQDVLRCDLCDTPVPPMYCDICHIKLCLTCVGVHLSDQSKEHKVVLFEKRGSTPKCQKHATKICDIHCEQCNIPICTLCIFSGEHEQHKKEDISKTLAVKKEKIQKELEELEKIIFPQYQEAATNIPFQKTDARKHCKELRTSLQKQGEALHKEIDNVIQKMLSEIDAMDSQYLAAINKQEKAINCTITEIEKMIAEIKALLNSDDFYFVSDYKSRNAEFRRMPAQFQVTLPTFTPKEIDREHIYQQLGSLSKLAIKTEEHQEDGSPTKTSGAESSPSARSLIDEPLILSDINTVYGDNNRLGCLSCMSDNEFWTRGQDSTMRLYNLQGNLLKSVQTKSKNIPTDITVTQNHNLVYTDYNDSSINIVKDTHIQPLITLRGWKPLYLCNTSSGDLLVTMVSVDYKQLKIVRYSGSTEIQSIQWDDKGNALYSSTSSNKYLSENRNLDICLADWTASAVVVVSAAGRLRFRYTGPPPSTTTTETLFKPYGITTDSQGRILITESNKHRIHVVEQDGHFLRYIDNIGLQCPIDLCVDSLDNLFVAECILGNVKKIQYSK
ncbi:uncharacterized protein LOC111107747 [Crassostrea virginica]